MHQPTAAASRPRPVGWTAAGVVLGLLLIALLALHAETMAQMVRVWSRSNTHAFSFLIVPISAYFVWLRRPLLATIPPRPWPAAALLAVPAGLLWLIGELAQAAVLAQFAFVALVQVAILAVLGWTAFRVLLFPVLLLWLMVPFGESLLPALIDLTMVLTVAGLGMLGMEVSTDGNILITEIGRFGVVEACSALDFIIGNTAISLVYANLMFAGWRKRTLYVLAGIPVAILANGVRTTGVIWLTYVSDRSINLIGDHETFGWLLFCAAVAAQMGIGWRFRDPPDTIVATPTTRPATASRPAWLGAIAVLAVAAVGPTVAASVVDDVPPGPALTLCPPPALGMPQPMADWRPRYRGASAELAARYSVDGLPVDLYVAAYPRLGTGREMVGFRNRPFDGRTWHRLAQASNSVRVDGNVTSVREIRLRGPDRARRLVWQVYWIDGRFVAAPWAAKLWRLANGLSGGDGAAVLLMSADSTADPAAARAAMQKLLDRGRLLAPLLQATRSGTGC
ncbi:MAG: EpsI family protein [Alphaproteobacteria bacterium]